MRTRFEWDRNKARSNLNKHGIRFSNATRIFNDPKIIMIQDRIVDGEYRWQAYGLVFGELLQTAYTIRDTDSLDEKVIRIISARKASRKERKIYDRQNR